MKHVIQIFLLVLTIASLAGELIALHYGTTKQLLVCAGLVFLFLFLFMESVSDPNNCDDHGETEDY